MEIDIRVKWQCGADTPFVDGRYSRAHAWSFDGGAEIKASASPHIVPIPFSDPTGVDPEEALVAAISSCHMLYFLSLAAKAGFKVESYEDLAQGMMEKAGDGRQWITTAVLKPTITFGGDKRPTESEVDDLHHQSHELCFIANSVRTLIRVDGENRGVRSERRSGNSLPAERHV